MYLFLIRLGANLQMLTAAASALVLELILLERADGGKEAYRANASSSSGIQGQTTGKHKIRHVYHHFLLWATQILHI